MAITKVSTGVIADSAVTTTQILDATVVTADMAVDPTNASNLTSGSVPLAQLGNAPATDTTSIEADIALLGFRVAANGSLAKYNLDDQTVDAFEDATGIDASASTNEVRNAANYYVGQTGTTPTASGGTVTVVGDYTIHSFLSGSTAYANNTAQDTDILIVAGAGGGGGHDGAGAGAGGVRVLAAQAIGTSGATVVVGGGGGGVLTGQGGDGGNSSVAISGGATLSATGGGGGGSESQNGRTGGSGGGGGQYQTGGGAAGNAGSYSPVEGYGGGNGSGSAPGYSGGGGGGAGQAGSPPDASGNYGHGGDGIQNNYRTGSNVYYGGGGGGSGRVPAGGTGGQGGGGNGGNDASKPGGAGTVNTGGGGGGGGDTSGPGGAGGTGIVVLKRLTTTVDRANLILVSNSTTAQTAPTKGDIVMTYTNGAGTATLNTDLTAEFSADNGSTWTSTTLVAQGSTGAHLIVSAHDITRTSTSGTSMVYRIKTLNQAVAKETRIQAVSLGWS